MEKDLRTALLNKEKAELFLSNLEKLRNGQSVNEMTYNALQAEYSRNLQNALTHVERIKQELNKTLASKKRELDIYKQELANLDARFKVGQIPAGAFLKLAKNPEKKIASLEDQVSHLTSLLGAKHSGEVSLAEASGIGSLFASKSKTEMKSSGTGILYQEQPASSIEPPTPIPVPTPASEPAPVRDATTISSLSILPDHAFPGSTIGIIATIVNSGASPLIHRAEFKVNGRIEATHDINLNPGQSEEMTFMTVAGAPGDYRVSVDNVTGILKVLPAQ